MSYPKKVIIAGGGIGGLALAAALQKIGMDSLDYLVLEKSPKISEVGAGVNIWSNGAHCLNELGLKGLYEEKALPFAGCMIQNHNKALAELDFSDFKERFGAPAAIIHRADLIDVLARGCAKEKIVLSAHVQSFKQDSQGIEVQLAGGEKIKGSLLIGADGIHSAVRKGWDKRQPRYAGYTCWRGLFPMDEKDSAKKSFLILGPGKECGFARIHQKTGYWFAAARAAPDPGRSLNLEILKKPFSGWHEELRAMISRTDEGAIIRNDILDFPPQRNWGHGRATLLGDAAHASTPHLAQGASMALEDALELAVSLRQTGRNARALRQYEKKRYRRCAALVRESRFSGKLSQLSQPLLAKARDLAYLSSNKWLLRYSVKRWAGWRPPSLAA